jgi:predicted transcriptional regulator
MEKEWKRVFNLKFINKKINGLTFGIIQLFATYNKELNHLYITKEKLKEVKQIIIKKLNVSDKTAHRYIKQLIDEDLIIETEEKNYIINAVDTNIDNYQKVNFNILECIVNNSINEFDLQIYVYLLNKFNYKNNYNFTLLELSVAFGYSKSYRGNNNMKIKESLKNLRSLNIINYKNEYIEKTIDKKKIPVSIFVLQNVK